MSQEKVAKYKEQKANRKEIMKKEKRARIFRNAVVPTPVFWPGEFHGLYSPLGHRESDTTE